MKSEVDVLISDIFGPNENIKTIIQKYEENNRKLKNITIPTLKIPTDSFFEYGLRSAANEVLIDICSLSTQKDIKQFDLNRIEIKLKELKKIIDLMKKEGYII